MIINTYEKARNNIKMLKYRHLKLVQKEQTNYYKC